MNILQRPLGTSDLTISQLGLGTVEIGLPYGIGVKNLPSDAEAERILKTAVELGITYIDTARGYGLAEERIGKSGITKIAGVIIGTKCGQFLKTEPTLRGAELEKRIREEIDMSRTNLQLEILDLVQLHIELPDYGNLSELIEIMQKLVDEKKVRHVGIATRGEELPLAAITRDFFVSVQTAYNILDQRMASRVLPAAQEKNVSIINRSVLLKGALTPAAEKLPDTLAPLKKNAAQAAAIAQELGIDLPTLALRFVLSHPAIITALIGTVIPAHLTAAAKAVSAGPLPKNVLVRLHALAIDDPQQVDPAQWPTIS